MKKTLFILANVLLPGVVLAAGATANSILTTIKSILDTVIPIIMTLALIGFFWGLAMYIFKADEDKEKGREIMIYGILALFVMTAVWGLVQVLITTFNVSGGSAPKIDLPK